MSKRLNTDSITNELVNSSFFRQRSTPSREVESPSRPLAQPAVVEPFKTVVTEPASAPTPKPMIKTPVAPAVPIAAPAGRRYVRRTFDFYEDQIVYLTRASLEEKLAGGEGSMNAMVREAIDAFIEKRSKK